MKNYLFNAVMLSTMAFVLGACSDDNSGDEQVSQTPIVLMGKAYTYASGTQRGLSYSSGIIVDGEYKAIDSGTLGGNSERAEKFNSGATIFYGLGGFCGVVCVGTFLGRKKK